MSLEFGPKIFNLVYKYKSFVNISLFFIIFKMIVSKSSLEFHFYCSSRFTINIDPSTIELRVTIMNRNVKLLNFLVLISKDLSLTLVYFEIICRIIKWLNIEAVGLNDKLLEETKKTIAKSLPLMCPSLNKVITIG